MVKILVAAAIIAGAALFAVTVVSCAMLSSQISRAEERAEAERHANLKNQNLVYNREQEATNHEQADR